MDLLSLAFIAALSVPPRGDDIDFDAPINAARAELDSDYLRDMMTVAMATPYKYKVTQMECRARVLQPDRGWQPAREPSGRISWVPGAAFKVQWSGIYGTCFIQSPREKDELAEGERAALECECNGWLPMGITDYPQP
ncbi:MAG TPA: hypothetical protein VM029_07405 [Opitutaceae bacterium]|nr:hypothetical protein [Opitutaceae bacterium]